MTAQEHAANSGDGRSQPPRRGWKTLQGWPSLAAIALVGLVAFRMESGREIAPILAASGLVYLGAAALQKRAAAWPLFLLTFVVITAGRFGWIPFDATWALLGLAGLLLGYGLVRQAARPGGGLPLQTVAMAVFGAAAALALLVDETIGAYLVAAGLLAHAGWDAYHHWTNKVVARSLAEFCFVLDTLLAAAIVVATLRG